VSASTINAHKRTLHIVASQLREGDRVVQSGPYNVRARGAVVGRLVKFIGNAGVTIQVEGTVRGFDHPHIIFRSLNPDLPMVVERDPEQS
jgi:hypothetical protein